MHILVVHRSTPRHRSQDQPAGVERLRYGSASAAKALYYLSPRCHSLLGILAVEVEERKMAAASETTVGKFAMSLLDQITYHALTICKRLRASQVLSIMNTEKGTTLMNHPLVLFHFLKDTNVQSRGLLAGTRYGIIMFPTPSLQKLRGIRIR